MGELPLYSGRDQFGCCLKDCIKESITIHELSRAASRAAWRRLVDACSIEAMLIGLRDALLLMVITSFALAHSLRLERTSKMSRILRYFHQRSVQILGTRHPVTLLTDSSTSRLPRKTLGDISEGILQIDCHRCSIIYRRRGMHSPQSSLGRSLLFEAIQNVLGNQFR